MLLPKGFRAVVPPRQSTRHLTPHMVTNPLLQHDPRTRHGSPPSSDLPDTGTGRPPLHGSWLEPTSNCRRRPIWNTTDVRLRATWLTAGWPVTVWLQSPGQYSVFKITWPSGIPQMYSSHGYPQVLTDDLRNPELERTRLYDVSVAKKSWWTYPNLFNRTGWLKQGLTGQKSSRFHITSYRTIPNRSSVEFRISPARQMTALP